MKLQPHLPRRTRRHPRRCRGVAMLLVTIALVISTILLAGYLSTQGTAIGIARNESDHDHCRAVAESGADLCMWLIRNKTNWRETMTPGNWLSNYALAGGTVTVAVTDGNGASSFTTNNTHSIVVSSTGTYDSRSFTVQATMTPTGGGTPWSGGAFASGTMVISNSARVDSYNSAVGPYSSSNHGSNALWWSNYIGAGAFQSTSSTAFYGSVTIAPNASMSAVLYNPGKGPAGVSSALESRTPGPAILPNMVSFTTTGDYTQSGSTTLLPANQSYNSLTLNNSAFVTISQSCTFRVRGALSINNTATLKIDTGANVTIVVDGGVTVNSTIQVANTGSLTIYAGSFVDFNSATVNMSGSNANTPAGCTIFGQSNCTYVKFEGNTQTSCLVFAPTANFDLQDSAKLYGSVIANTFTVQSSAMFHQDQAAQTVTFHNIGNASTMGDYRITWQQ